MAILIHLSTDLMMSSTVKISAARHNIEYMSIPSIQKLAALEVAENVLAIFVDLQTPGIDIDHLKSHFATQSNDSPPVWLYVQHVNEELLAAAKSIAIATVMTRGQFNRDVDRLIQGLATRKHDNQ